MKSSFSTIVHCYTFCSMGTFAERVQGLLSQIPAVKTIVSITLFSAGRNESYHRELRELRSLLENHLGYQPLVTYVLQPSSEMGGATMEVYSLDVPEVDVREAECGIRYLPYECEGNELLLVEGITSSSFLKPMSEQSEEIFERLSLFLKEFDLTASSIIRQWNYIGNITAINDGVQHYQAFNDARTKFYATDSWERGYPAATGIGASCDGLVVSCIICRKGIEGCRAINNPLQVAAHAYNERLLIGDEMAQKTTPKFERAKSIIHGNTSVCYISGTAAIRGEESLHGADAVTQTLQTIENIEYLISDENMLAHGSRACGLEPYSLRVYVKNREDVEAVRNVVKARWSTVAQLYLEADVCRGELLVEIEGAAKGGVR